MQKHREMGLTAPIVQLPNFVSFQEESRSSRVRDKPQKPKVPYFLFVGRLEKIKGLQTVIGLFRHFAGAELWIAGKGGYESHLKRLAGASRNIRFLGYKQGHALDRLYQGAVALIVPSLCVVLGRAAGR